MAELPISTSFNSLEVRLVATGVQLERGKIDRFNSLEVRLVDHRGANKERKAEVVSIP